MRRGKARRIMRLNRETGAEFKIFTFPLTQRFFLSLSPSGEKLALLSDDGIRLIPVTGGEPDVFIPVENATTLSWMRDGRRILYGKSRQGSEDIVELWSVPSEGGNPRRLNFGMSRLMHLRVSPDGRHIAFTASEQPAKREVWVMENIFANE